MRKIITIITFFFNVNSIESIAVRFYYKVDFDLILHTAILIGSSRVSYLA